MESWYYYIQQEKSFVRSLLETGEHPRILQLKIISSQVKLVWVHSTQRDTSLIIQNSQGKTNIWRLSNKNNIMNQQCSPPREVFSESLVSMFVRIRDGWTFEQRTSSYHVIWDRCFRGWITSFSKSSWMFPLLISSNMSFAVNLSCYKDGYGCVFLVVLILFPE